MSRRSIVGLLVAMLVTALGGPASAKGPLALSLTGSTTFVPAVPQTYSAIEPPVPLPQEVTELLCAGGDEVPPVATVLDTIGITCPPANGGPQQRITAGHFHTCALISDDTARCWGWNFYGQLGDGTAANRHTPVQVSGLTDTVAITAGGTHTCALISDGTARCWGWNGYGQLGDGTTTDRHTPIQVSGLTDAVAIVAGERHTCALITDGTARCWGWNGYGQLGDGTTTDRHTPIQVSGLTDAVAITAGGGHTCALISDSTARCWGRNGYGQLGDGTANRTTPVQVSGLTDAVAIVAGGGHTCALISDGTARCWGANGSGQLGNGTRTDLSTPSPVVVSGLTDAVAITAGGFHTCALISDGTARCWGANNSGQIGDGNTAIFRTTPVQVSELTDAVAITAGLYHTCALISDSTARCWGNNSGGQLGDGTTTNRYTPTRVEGLP